MKHYEYNPSGLYFKHMMIENDDFCVINKLGASLTDDARVAIYNRHMFIVEATDVTNPCHINQNNY